MTAIAYTLLIDDVPASAELLDAIQEIEVEDHADIADMLRLRIAVAVQESGRDWTVVDEDLFGRLAKIKLSVTIGSESAQTLIEGYVIETNAELSNQPGHSVLEVVAMDPTVKMMLEEKVRAWPDMADSAIAETILGEYGFDVKVEQTQPQRQRSDITTLQRGSDIQFLRQLARRNGFECYVEVDSATGSVQGHFHPPRLEQTPQGVLTVNMGEATNADSFSAHYAMLRPARYQAMGLDIASGADQSGEAEAPKLETLGRESSLTADRPRLVLLGQTALSQAAELQTYAQAGVDRSAWAITAEGELHTVAYGGLLRAKRPVNVRGAGRQFSGTYYVQRVLHRFSDGGYTQHFTLRRNALGLTGQERFVDDQALSAG